MSAINYLITALKTIAEDKLTFSCVRDRLIHEHDKWKNGKAGDFLVKPSSSNQDALFTKGSKKSADTKKIKCFYCKKKGHMAKDCFNPIQYGLFLKHYGMGGHYPPPPL